MDPVFSHFFNSPLPHIRETPKITPQARVESIVDTRLRYLINLSRSLFFNHRDDEYLNFKGESNFIVFSDTTLFRIQSFLCLNNIKWIRNLLIPNEVSEDKIEHCFLMPRLVSINIRRCKLSMQALKNLSKTSSGSLKTLILSDCVFDLDCPFSSVISRFPKLRKLMFANCKGLDLNQFSKCPELDHLVLTGSFRSAKEVPFESLETISIENSTWNDEEMAPFLQNAKTIKLVNCPNITSNCKKNMENADVVSMIRVPKIRANRFMDITNTPDSRITTIYIRDSA